MDTTGANLQKKNKVPGVSQQLYCVLGNAKHLISSLTGKPGLARQSVYRTNTL